MKACLCSHLVPRPIRFVIIYKVFIIMYKVFELNI